MNYNTEAIKDEIGDFNYTMTLIKDDASIAETVDSLLLWLEHDADVRRMAKDIDNIADLEALKKTIEAEDTRPDVVIWAVRRVVRALIAADSLHRAFVEERRAQLGAGSGSANPSN